ncbi:MAG: leucine-rich repeat protein [Synechococcus sp. SB0675_bin_6]|nr:leucine-rich repeat protein [Synechococcus sp. SB0675_bin_6]
MDDSTNEVDGSISVIVDTGTGYTVGSSATATVAVADDDTSELQAVLEQVVVPEITITADSGVSEGTAASFILTASPAPAEVLNVAVTVKQSDDHVIRLIPWISRRYTRIVTRTTTIAIPTGGTATYTVTTVNDNYDEIDRFVAVTVDAGTGYTVGSSSSAQVVVHDDDPTVVTIDQPKVARRVKEGDKFFVSIQLGRSLLWDEIIDVPLSISGTGVTTDDWSLKLSNAWYNKPERMILSGETTATPNLRFWRASPSSAELELTVVADGVTEGDETIVVALGPDGTGANGFDRTSLGTNVGGGVNLSTRWKRVSVSVADVHKALVFTPKSLTVNEGGSKTYTVKLATQPSGGDVTVTVSGTSSTDVTVDTDRKTGGNQNTLTFTTANWNRGQTATVVAGQDTDKADDSVTLSHAASGGGYNSVTGDVVVTVDDDDAPKISITGGAGINESSDASFTVKADPAPTANLSVNLKVTESSGDGQDFVAAGNEGNKTVVIQSGQTSATYTVFTVDDLTDEVNGKITVALRDPTAREYKKSTPATATTTIKDNDPTVVSLARVGSGGLLENDTVEFMVTLGRALIAGEIIDVPLSISGTGVTTADWSLAKKVGGSLNTGVTLSNTSTATPKLRFSGAGAQTATLALLALADGVSEASESITVALGPDGTGTNGFDHTNLDTNVGGGADPHVTRKSFSVTVADLGKALVLTPKALTVDEGRSKSYTVKLATQPSGGDVTVTVSGTSSTDVTVDTDGVESGNQNTLTFTSATWNSEQTVTVTAAQDTDQADDSVTLSHAASGGGYNSVTDDVAVTINDDDKNKNICERYSVLSDDGILCNLERKGITSLRSSDFAGLSNLQHLYLDGNNLSSLPEDIFDGLPNLWDLYLNDNDLVSLPEDVFDGLSNLGKLRLENNKLTSLSEDVFDGLSNLRSLDLENNKLTNLPEEVFDGLSKLRYLNLGLNNLSSLPENIFDGLSSLRWLYLNKNDLSSLPEEVFDGLSNLQLLLIVNNKLSSLSEDIFDGLSKVEFLWLTNNKLSSLPENILDGLSSLHNFVLHGNQLSSLPEDIFDGLSIRSL